MKRDAVYAANSRRLVSLYRRIALYGVAAGWFVSIAAMIAFCLLRQRNLESEPNERGQCATEAERHCDHGRTVEWWTLDRVRPYEQNPRVISDVAINKVAASIKAGARVVGVDPERSPTWGRQTARRSASPSAARRYKDRVFSWPSKHATLRNMPFGHDRRQSDK